MSERVVEIWRYALTFEEPRLTSESRQEMLMRAYPHLEWEILLLKGTLAANLGQFVLIDNYQLLLPVVKTAFRLIHNTVVSY